MCISTKYLQLLLACNKETIMIFSRPKFRAGSCNSNKSGLMTNTELRTERPIIDRQKRGLLTSRLYVNCGTLLLMVNYNKSWISLSRSFTMVLLSWREA